MALVIFPYRNLFEGIFQTFRYVAFERCPSLRVLSVTLIYQMLLILPSRSTQAPLPPRHPHQQQHVCARWVVEWVGVSNRSASIHSCFVEHLCVEEGVCCEGLLCFYYYCTVNYVCLYLLYTFLHWHFITLVSCRTAILTVHIEHSTASKWLGGQFMVRTETTSEKSSPSSTTSRTSSPTATCLCSVSGGGSGGI